MATVIIYTTRYCPYCIQAKELLKSKSVNYTEIPVDNDPQLRMEMEQKSGQYTVPQIWIGEYHVGGCDELFALHRQNKLDNLLGS
ncbi:MAG: glutaredoxin 3 [Pseudomonadales bacterium]|nr:glutaredoxin 3 [Pseudomonadales bacterium]